MELRSPAIRAVLVGRTRRSSAAGWRIDLTFRSRNGTEGAKLCPVH
jgi:hypothetical protein